jgi:hypothetical protein
VKHLRTPTRHRLRISRLVWGPLTALCALHAQAQPQSSALGDTRAQGGTDRKKAADALFRKGLDLANSERFSEAASAFDEAYRTSPHFAVLYNAAQAHQRAGHLAKALEAFQRYLDEGGPSVPPKRASEVREQVGRLRERLGEVAVSVSPADATVFIDGERASDHRAPVEPGEHVVLVARAGPSSEVRIVSVRARETVRVSVTLAEPPSAPPPSGWLSIECSVPAVLLALDGQPATKLEGRAWIGASAGAHRVELRRAGYRPDVRSVTVESDRVLPLRCEMKPLEPLMVPWKATLAVGVHPSDAEVFLDDAPVPSSGTVPVGLHRLRVARSGYVPWAQDIVLEARQPTKIDLSLRPTRAYADQQREHVARQRSWSYGFLGAGGLLAGVAGYLFLDARSDWTRWDHRQDELDALWADASAERAGPVDEQRRNDALARSIQGETQVAIALGAIGLGALAQGAYLYLTADSASETPDPSSRQRHPAETGTRRAPSEPRPESVQTKAAGDRR